MAKFFSLPTLCLLLLALNLSLANSARHLDDVTPDDLPPLPTVQDPTTDLPNAQAPGTIDAPDVNDSPPPYVEPEQPQPDPDNTVVPISGGASGTTQSSSSATTVSGGSSASSSSTTSGGASTGTSTTQTSSSATTVSGSPDHPTISFYMHDVLGGSHASGRIVTGLIASQNANGIPFSRPNSQVFPVSNGVPLANNNLNSLFNNNNNIPGLSGQNNQQSTIISNAGTNNVVNNGGNSNSQAFVTPGQLPSGLTLQKLMFGSITVIDDELTEGHELGSGVIGKGQGFYLASSLDGESHTMAFSALFPKFHVFTIQSVSHHRT